MAISFETKGFATNTSIVNNMLNSIEGFFFPEPGNVLKCGYMNKLKVSSFACPATLIFISPHRTTNASTLFCGWRMLQIWVKPVWFTTMWATADADSNRTVRNRIHEGPYCCMSALLWIARLTPNTIMCLLYTLKRTCLPQSAKMRSICKSGSIKCKLFCNLFTNKRPVVILVSQLN